MMKCALFVAFALCCLHTLSVFAEPIGCDQAGAWNATAFAALIQQLQNEPNEITKEEITMNALDSSAQGLTSNQTLTLLMQFRNEITMEDIMVTASKYILGLTVRDDVTLLNTFNNEITRLSVLRVLVNLTIDLRQNNQSLIGCFVNYFNQQEAQQIINTAAPRSCVWGDVSAKRLIFIVDTSGSMSATFPDPATGKTVTRLQFVASQLDTVVRQSLTTDQEFNLISFAGYARAWQPGVVPVNDTTISSAVTFIKGMVPNGGTSMLNALQTAFADPKALAVYLLTDGVPTDASPAVILKAATQWSTAANPPRPVNAIAFMAGGTPDPNAAAFMQQLASATGGIYRSVK